MMAINANDVKIMRPERATDETDGGGMMTGIAIASGDINNLWDDIPRTMLAMGGVSMRKLYCAVRSANTDKFLGAHAILAQDAVADNVSTLLFDTNDHYDERLQAQDSIEQFVVLGTRSALRPVGTQRSGQRALVLYADRETDEPEVGAVLFLMQGVKQQPVKVLKASTARMAYTYLDRNGDPQTYHAYQVSVDISQPLEHSFDGSDPAPAVRHATEIFNTQSNSGARYYGIKPLAKAAQAGDRSVVVDGIFSPIVPAATTEQAIIDQVPGISQRTVQVSGVLQARSLGTVTGAQSFTLPLAWLPGSLRLKVGGSEYAENGNGLRLLSGSDYISDAVLNAPDGVLSFTVAGSRAVSVEYLPGVALELTPYTKSVEISAGNRQITYTEQLQPVPLPGSVRVEFSFLGRWYVVMDNGTGELSGNGVSGAINYSTGSISLTLPSEPDVGSRIIYTWAQSSFSQVTAGARDVFIAIDLEGMPAAGSAVVNWRSGSVDRSASAQADNTLSGAADGMVRGSQVLFRSANLPSGSVTVNYQRQLAGEQLVENIAVSEKTGGSITLNTGVPNLRPETVSFALNTTYTVTTNVAGTVSTTRLRRQLQFVGAANGMLFLADNRSAPVGSIASATGVITVWADEFSVTVDEWVLPSPVLQNWQRVTVTKLLRFESQTAEVRFYSSDATEAASVTVPFEQLRLIAQISDRPLVPGALMLSVGGVELVDRGDGHLYHGWNGSTGAGVQCGALNYSGGSVEIAYSALQSQISTLNSRVIAGVDGVGAAAAVVSVVFRTVASPLRTGGLQFLARRASDGALMRAVSDNDGNITGSFDPNDTLDRLPQPGSVNGYSLPFVPTPTTGGSVSGVVDYATGVVEISFSQPVILSALTYNAVTYTTVPLSPAALGLNPVRLPTNGMVPVFQSGYLVVIHNTQKITISTPVAGAVIDCGRTGLAQAFIRDAAGVDLDAAMYTVNKVAGTVTLADPFIAQDADANSLTMPLTLSHRIEDMAAVGVVLIDGTLQLLTDLRNDYPVEGTFVSAAINFGTLQARVRNLFDQQTDTGWSDTPGAPATASYDALNYPILIDNRSAVEERWRLRFTSATGFQCEGEQRGVIGVGSVNADFSPINPMTGEPYFTIRAAGWGSGWVTSNVLRFNTDAAAAPLWAIRTVLPDSEPLADDVISVEFRGDAD